MERNSNTDTLQRCPRHLCAGEHPHRSLPFDSYDPALVANESSAMMDRLLGPCGMPARPPSRVPLPQHALNVVAREPACPCVHALTAPIAPPLGAFARRKTTA